MSAMSGPHSDLDLQEQISRIDDLILRTQKAQVDIEKGRVEMSRLRFDMRRAPWQIVASSAGAGAALFATGAAFVS